jgi:hypothetical protein
MVLLRVVCSFSSIKSFIKTIPGMEGGGIKENDGGGEFTL